MKRTNKQVSELGLSGYRMIAGKKVEWNPLAYQDYNPQCQKFSNTTQDNNLPLA